MNPFQNKLLAASLFFTSAVSQAAPFSPVFKRDLPDTFAPAFERKSLEQHWQETGLKLKHFYDDVLPQCQLNTKAFNGCWAALETLAILNQPGTLIAFEIEKQQLRPDLGTIRASLGGGLAIYDRVPLQDNTAVQEKRKIRLKAVEQAYQAGAPIPFEKLFQDLASGLRQKLDEEAYWAANLYNAFLAKTDDPHSRLMPMSLHRESLSSDGKNYKGLGLDFDSFVQEGTNPQEYVHVVRKVFAGSPADLAGIRMGDHILTIHGINTASLDRPRLYQQLLKSDEVLLEVKHRNGTTQTIRATRAEVKSPTIESKMLPPVRLSSRYNGTATATHRTGWIKIADFMDQNLPDDFQRAYVNLLQAGANAIIIDLQDNGGGLLSSAAALGALLTGVSTPIFGVSSASADVRGPLQIDFFSLEGLILKNVPRNENRRVQKALKEYPTDLKTPIVVLQNAGSASASELFAGALQDHQRAWIVGDRSFGKGTVQGPSNYPFSSYSQDAKSPKIGFWKTLQRFHQPSGRSNQIQGILPNFSVPVSTLASEAEAEDTDREEDVFEGAIPVVSKPWQEPRPLRVSKIDQCRNALKYAEDQEAQERTADNLLQALGYRVFSAQEILICDAVL